MVWYNITILTSLDLAEHQFKVILAILLIKAIVEFRHRKVTINLNNLLDKTYEIKTKIKLWEQH